MLTKEQVEYALGHPCDLIEEFTGNCIVEVYHTDRGVYTVIRDNMTREIFFDLCWYATYETLSMINARSWPIYPVSGQRATVEHNGAYFSVTLMGSNGVLKTDPQGLHKWKGTATKDVTDDPFSMMDDFLAEAPLEVGSHWSYCGFEVHIIEIMESMLIVGDVNSDQKTKANIAHFKLTATPTRIR